VAIVGAASEVEAVTEAVAGTIVVAEEKMEVVVVVVLDTFDGTMAIVTMVGAKGEVVVVVDAGLARPRQVVVVDDESSCRPGRREWVIL
jgi:hypothetical protein